MAQGRNPVAAYIKKKEDEVNNLFPPQAVSFLFNLEIAEVQFKVGACEVNSSQLRAVQNLFGTEYVQAYAVRDEHGFPIIEIRVTCIDLFSGMREFFDEPVSGGAAEALAE